MKKSLEEILSELSEELRNFVKRIWRKIKGMSQVAS
jgi:hypothetical protein